MLTEDQAKDIQLCKDLLFSEIKKTVESSDKIWTTLNKEIQVSVIYLKIFKAYLDEKNFTTLEEAWLFMNDMKGIIEKVFYVRLYIPMKEEGIKEKVHA